LIRGYRPPHPPRIAPGLPDRTPPLFSGQGRAERSGYPRAYAFLELRMIKRLLALLICLAAFVLPACTGLQAPAGSSVEHRYFLAKHDYVQAKRAAVLFAGLPSTPGTEVAIIRTFVRKGDDVISRFDALKGTMGASRSDYDRVLDMLQYVTNELRTSVLPRAQPPALSPTLES
jgi:hypothetical protein